MININDNDIVNLPLATLVKVGILFYHEYPTTTILSDQESNPYVLEWIDCTDDGETDIFILYKTTKKLLAKFLDNGISHKIFIERSILQYCITFENELLSPKNVRLLTFEEVDSSYLPNEGVYFNQKNSVELDQILHFFKIFPDRGIVAQANELRVARKISPISLNTQKAEVSQIEIVKELANEQSIQVLNIHLLQGANIKYGTANTHILGNILTSFDNLYKSAALDVIEGINRGNFVSYTTKKSKVILPKISTEVFLQKAASFSLFLRPVLPTQQYTLVEGTENDLISNKIFSLFSASDELDSFETIFNKYSSYVHKSFITFLEVIKENDLTVEYNFYSPFTKQESTKGFDAINAWKALDMIRNYSKTTDDKFNLDIKFTALNCNTCHYYCEDVKKRMYSGHFDKMIKESMPNLNFTDFYSVVVERKIIKKASNIEPKIEDTIVSCLPHKK